MPEVVVGQAVSPWWPGWAYLVPMGRCPRRGGLALLPFFFSMAGEVWSRCGVVDGAHRNELVEPMIAAFYHLSSKKFRQSVRSF